MVAGYEYRVNGGSPVDVGDVLTASVTGLDGDTEYDFEVRAYDDAGNYSAWSSVVSETTDPAPASITMPWYFGQGFTDGSTGIPFPSNPTGIQDGDILVLFVETANESVSTPTGWTALSTASNSGTNPTRLSVFWKRASLPETDPDIADAGEHTSAQVLAFRGCLESGDPWDVTASSSGSSGTSITVPGATTTTDGCLVIAAAATTQASNSSTKFSGWTNSDLTEVNERTDFTDADGGGFGVATGLKETAGAYGSTTATQADSVEWAGWTGALKPAVTPVPVVATVGAFQSFLFGATIPLPDYREDDILIAFIESRNEAATLPGWTQAGSSPASNSGTNPTRLTVFWKRAGASETAPTTGEGSGDHQHVQMFACRNITKTGDPFDATNSTTGGTGTSISITGVTTTVNNCLVISAVGTTRDSTSSSIFSSWANANLTYCLEFLDRASSTNAGGGFGAAVGIKSTAGATGATTVTQSTSVEYVTWMGALKPE